MKRRDFLTLAASLPLTLHATRLLAAPATDQRLLVVFMRGAYDAASLLVPQSDFYYESRPTIAVARAGSGPDAALPLADGWGLHPALADTLLPYYQRGELAFVPFAGTEDLTRSHFETQNRIERGAAADDGPARVNSGFLNRLAQQLGMPAVAFTQDVPQIFRGQASVPNISLAGAARKGRLNDTQGRIITEMYQGTELEDRVIEGMDLKNAAQRMDAEQNEANGKSLTVSRLQAESQRIAGFMRERYNLGFVDVGGWDTHVNQGDARGSLAGKLKQLGQALNAYAQAMGPAWKKTTVVVISEFGRTFRENGTRGTDHGHGTVYWVMGGQVRGGRIAGEQVAVAPGKLFQDRDYPVLTEYRALFGGLFARLYGMDAKRLAAVFPGVRPLDLKLV
ncbi:DUF1501 domain-containing protein [Bordetella genomosp. 12]|uniref:DUF1501 domain-containing protein n=1 Tax=Bordetella genomosp. 12 TaxID=463035 RepID=A0A261VMP9_9BORD|nr:DUF1501 domain-containing protein [Bordetella genomosp. 12]OZI74762.1 hypothetical protein CAL22_09935 [Bordetella genomosp. 12]